MYLVIPVVLPFRPFEKSKVYDIPKLSDSFHINYRNLVLKELGIDWLGGVPLHLRLGVNVKDKGAASIKVAVRVGEHSLPRWKACYVVDCVKGADDSVVALIERELGDIADGNLCARRFALGDLDHFCGEIDAPRLIPSREDLEHAARATSKLQKRFGLWRILFEKLLQKERNVLSLANNSVVMMSKGVVLIHEGKALCSA